MKHALFSLSLAIASAAGMVGCGDDSTSDDGASGSSGGSSAGDGATSTTTTAGTTSMGTTATTTAGTTTDATTGSTTASTGIATDTEALPCFFIEDEQQCIDAGGCMPIQGSLYTAQGDGFCLGALEFIGCDQEMACPPVVIDACDPATPDAVYQVPSGCIPANWQMCNPPGPAIEQCL